MSLEYIRDHYRMPWLKRGVRVQTIRGPGVVTRGTAHVFVLLDGGRNDLPFHPDDVRNGRGDA